MPDDQDQEKTQDPTPKRRQEARQEGNVAKSQDLAASVVLAGSLVQLQSYPGSDLLRTT